MRLVACAPGMSFGVRFVVQDLGFSAPSAYKACSPPFAARAAESALTVGGRAGLLPPHIAQEPFRQIADCARAAVRLELRNYCSLEGAPLAFA